MRLRPPAIKAKPVTVKRKPVTDVLPRTLKARSKATDTTLQKHVGFFDDNGDRAVTITETANGLKAMGMQPISAQATATVIVLGLGKKTSGSFFKVSIDGIKKGKHDSDTDILSKTGRFNAAKFEKTFGLKSKVDVNGDRAFTASELSAMIDKNKQTFFGAFASKAEFGLPLKLGADTQVIEKGVSVPALSQGRMRSFYDGSLFYELARANRR